MLVTLFVSCVLPCGFRTPDCPEPKRIIGGTFDAEPVMSGDLRQVGAPLGTAIISDDGSMTLTFEDEAGNIWSARYEAELGVGIVN